MIKQKEHSIEDIINRLDQLIAAILDIKASSRIGHDAMLWETSDIAEYFKVSYRYTSEYVVTHNTFPGALRMPNKKGRKGHPRWYAKEVIEWAAHHQEYD